jgi:hypothetical protein
VVVDRLFKTFNRKPKTENWRFTMPCTVCQHPKRRDIDQALITGSATLAALSQEYGLSTSALHRHKAHLQANVNQAKAQLQDHLRQGCIFWLSQALETNIQITQTAQAEGNIKLVLQAAQQGIRLITIFLKQDIPLSDQALYATLTSPQWTAEASLLPHDPKIMALSRQSLAGTLASPCPDTVAPAASPVSPEDLDLVQQLLSDLSCPGTTGPKPGQQRKKSGKLPGKTSCRKHNNEKYQEDKLYEKISEIMDSRPLSQNLPLETGNSKLDTLFQQLAKGGEIPGNKPLSEYIYEQSLLENQ